MYDANKMLKVVKSLGEVINDKKRGLSPLK